jgi:serine/threonine protein kinase
VATTSTHITVGSTFAGCRIDALAGQGGMGLVFRVTQLDLGRTVALKVSAAELAGEPRFRERFQSESQLAASIDHPNVIPVYEAGESDGVLFLAMRHVPGTDLRAVAEEAGGLEPERVVRIVEQVAAGLDAAHRTGLVHRDVKPHNVLLAEDDHAYLTDFGLSKHATAPGGLTRSGQFVGALDYIAPEQIRGDGADARADVYALGAVLFYTLTGRPPFERDSELSKMYAHLHDPPPSASAAKPGVPPALDAVVATAMDKDSAARYASAGELAQAARAALDGAEQAPAHTRSSAGQDSLAAGPPPGGPAVVLPALPGGRAGAGSRCSSRCPRC